MDWVYYNSALDFIICYETEYIRGQESGTYSRDYQRECAHFGQSCWSHFKSSNTTEVSESAAVVAETTMASGNDWGCSWWTQDKVISSTYMCTHSQLVMSRDFYHLLSLSEWLLMCSVFFTMLIIPTRRKRDHFKASDLNTALYACIYMVQRTVYHGQKADLKSSWYVWNSSQLHSLCPVLDKHEMLQVGGRLKNSSLPYENQHQIIVPSRHHLTEFTVRADHQRLLHVGPQYLLASLQQEYWTARGR